MQLALEDWQRWNFQLNAYLAKFSFGSGVRLDFYRSLTLLISNQVRLNCTSLNLN